jgi:hypothetical protein
MASLIDGMLDYGPIRRGGAERKAVGTHNVDDFATLENGDVSIGQVQVVAYQPFCIDISICVHCVRFLLIATGRRLASC